jgi:hypothetical protein
MYEISYETDPENVLQVFDKIKLETDFQVEKFIPLTILFWGMFFLNVVHYHNLFFLSYSTAAVFQEFRKKEENAKKSLIKWPISKYSSEHIFESINKIYDE